MKAKDSKLQAKCSSLAALLPKGREPLSREPRLAAEPLPGLHPGLATGWDDPQRPACFPGLQHDASHWLCRGSVPGAWGGAAGSHRRGPGSAAGTETDVHVRCKSSKERFPWRSFTFLSFCWKLIHLVISITCVCLFVLLDTLSQQKLFSPISIFYQEQLLDKYSY